MAETEIRLEIVTPDSTVYSDIVDHVVVPTANGKVDLYQHHAPLIDRLDLLTSRSKKMAKSSTWRLDPASLRYMPKRFPSSPIRRFLSKKTIRRKLIRL